MFITDEEKKLTIEGCRFCPMCFHADTVAEMTHRETNSPRGRALVLFALEHGLLKWEDPAVTDVFYKSFTDGLPQAWCAGHYDADELVIDARHTLIEKGLAPEEVKRAAARIQLEGSPYGKDKGRDIFREMVSDATPGADLLVFAGCAARSLYPASLRALRNLLRSRGVAYQILDPEPCCGMLLYQLGDFSSASLQANKVSQKIAASGAKQVLCLDADCFRMMTMRFARFGALLPRGIEVTHASEWLCRMVRAEPWSFEKRDERITYHDPCSLARFTGLHDPPREVLAALFAEKPTEMSGNRDKAPCCGEGGGMVLTHPEMAREAARRRIEQARRTGATLLVTASPSCAALLSDACADGLAVFDLIEIVADSIMKS